MVAVKLIKLLSYNGFGVRASRDNPIVSVDQETAVALVGSGHFEYLAQPTPAPDPETKPARPKRAKK